MGLSKGGRMIDLDNLYGSWKYKRITREDIANAILKMNKNYEEKQNEELRDRNAGGQTEVSREKN